ncbi:MAG: 6-phosphofructokinase [Pilosibacter sp.]
MKFIGIPKTIDNDLVLTDHTPGFGSAAKYVASTVREIVLDASVYQQRSVTIVEISGTPRRMAHRCFQACKKI